MADNTDSAFLQELPNISSARPSTPKVPEEWYLQILLSLPVRFLFKLILELGMMILYMAILAYVMSYIMQNVLSGPMGDRKNIKKARKIMAKHGLKPVPKLTGHEQQIASKLVDPEEIPVGWEDIGGLDQVLEQVQRNIITPLVAQKTNMGVSKYARPPPGVLFHGPPGCGKTSIAKAIAKESGCLFINLEASDLVDKFYGESEKLASAVFSLASKLSPCIVFIDEIDSLMRSRSGRDHEVTANMKSLFMSLWDGLATDNSKTVIIMGATNLPTSVDSAILRRMSAMFHIPPPGLEQRASILELLLEDERLAQDVNIEQLAARTEGFTGSDLKEIVRSASVVALAANMDKLGHRIALKDIYSPKKEEKYVGLIGRVLQLLGSDKLKESKESDSPGDIKKRQDRSKKASQRAIKMEHFETAIRNGKESRTTASTDSSASTRPNASIQVDVNFNLNTQPASS